MITKRNDLLSKKVIQSLKKQTYEWALCAFETRSCRFGI